MVEAENAIIDSLQKMDLNYEEAQIYFNLLNYGESGTIVRKLREDLPFIERTTLYSILRRLIEKGCVEEESSSNKAHKLKTFIAKNPKEYFNTIFLKKKQEFEELQNIKTNILDDIQKIYDRGLEISYEDLDPYISPYFKALLANGWKTRTQKISKGINMFGVERYYEYHLQPPNNIEKKIDMVGLMISIYDSEIEDDDITLKFITKQLKKTIQEIHEGDFDNMTIAEKTIELLGRKQLSLLIKAREKKTKKHMEFGSTIILPIKNKIFFIWEELIHDAGKVSKETQMDILKDIIKSIFEAEGISFEDNS
jgi:predicted transcriptional regulator